MDAEHAPLIRLLFKDSGPSTEEVLQARDAIAANGLAVSENLLRNMLALAAMQPSGIEERLISRVELAKLADVNDNHIVRTMIESGMMEYRHVRGAGKLMPTEKGAAITFVVERHVMFRAQPALAFLAIRIFVCNS